ncbi:MAG: peptidase M48 [Proteobacteria bacterium]|nr:peptidase M48 [Verrucomicrobiota bacterium]NBU08918.1 peptidase M48 [Pseudomonadota bacterium]
MPVSINSFEAGAFHPDYGNRRVAGTLTLDGGMATFTSDEGLFAFPLTDLQINLGGASDRLVFFEHANFPKVSVFTTDQRVLEHPAFAQNSTLARARARIRRRQFVARCVTVGILALIVGTVAGVWLAKDPMVKALASQVPAEWEVKLGDTAFQQVSVRHKLITDAAVQKQLEQLAQPLLAVVPQDRYPFKLHIIEDASLNAFALPGGNVAIHSGLLLTADSPEEVLGVLGHELSHVTKQHGLRGIVQSLGLYAVVTTFFGDVSGLAAILVNNAPFLLTQKFSRDFEREADEQGFRYLEAAKLDPRGMISFFEKMRREEEKLREKLPGGDMLDTLDFLSTHPTTPERMARLEQLLAKSPRKDGFTKVDLDFKAFQKALRAKLSQSESGQRPEKKKTKPAE